MELLRSQSHLHLSRLSARAISGVEANDTELENAYRSSSRRTQGKSATSSLVIATGNAAESLELAVAEHQISVCRYDASAGVDMVVRAVGPMYTTAIEVEATVVSHW